jgi:hypothetical protein
MTELGRVLKSKRALNSKQSFRSQFMELSSYKQNVGKAQHMKPASLLHFSKFVH